MLVLLAFGIGTQEILLIAFIVLILFGATKLPKLASAVGESVKNLKKGMREAQEEDEEAKKVAKDDKDSPKKLESDGKPSDEPKEG
ncbi:MAG: twin-arginine translocase TatA/TatE family subunit [Proteobacteria bacterium]|nr:twin-arginine translocase TatA/TatE family subunit [Pseudomonadota bacterium]